MYCHTFLFHAAKLNVPLATTGLFIPSHFLGQKEVNSPAGSQCSFVFLLQEPGHKGLNVIYSTAAFTKA